MYDFANLGNPEDNCIFWSFAFLVYDPRVYDALGALDFVKIFTMDDAIKREFVDPHVVLATFQMEDDRGAWKEAVGGVGMGRDQRGVAVGGVGKGRGQETRELRSYFRYLSQSPFLSVSRSLKRSGPILLISFGAKSESSSRGLNSTQSSESGFLIFFSSFWKESTATAKEG